MILKTLFFSTAVVLASCTPPPPKVTSDREGEVLASESGSSDEKFKNMRSSREFFRYTVSDCTGETQEQADHYNGQKKEGFLDIEIDEGEVIISRPSKPDHLNVGLEGKWDHTTSLLTDLSGQFGIGTEEDWSQTSGSLYISEEDITGSIDGAQIRFSGFSQLLNSNVDISCSVSLSIEKKKD